MNRNSEFLCVLKESFIRFLQTNARSNEKLKILHSYIAKSLCNLLGKEEYSFYSLGFGDEKEALIKGRYLDKKVDITVRDKQNRNVCGIAVKFVMSNYSQNSNNYFENMLGETSNIRCNNVPYFQIFCIFDELPYYDKSGNIKKWESITEHNINKYLQLSKDNIDCYYHVPNKTLFYVVHLSSKGNAIKTKKDYNNYYLSNSFSIENSKLKFSFENSVIYNDYEKFLEKVMYTIKSI